MLCSLPINPQFIFFQGRSGTLQIQKTKQKNERNFGWKYHKKMAVHVWSILSEDHTRASPRMWLLVPDERHDPELIGDILWMEHWQKCNKPTRHSRIKLARLFVDELTIVSRGGGDGGGEVFVPYTNRTMSTVMSQHETAKLPSSSKKKKNEA